ncbi:MAG: DUF58 domain-containing protein [Balneolaceae bacterium]
MERGPEELDFLRSGVNLGLWAKYIVSGFMIGFHKGTRRGTGSEFSQYRSYQPGDDIRQIDWKMFARSDRYYIKESETESSVTVRFFLDASASMKYEEDGISRFRYASLVTAALGTLVSQQGDAIALHLVNNEDQQFLREKRGKAHLSRFVQMIEDGKCEGNWPESSNWLVESLTSHNREIWVICSDLLDGHNRWKKFVEMSEYIGHEVLFLQILGENEINLNLPDNVTVQDPESERRLNIRPQTVRKQYLQNLNNYLGELKTALMSEKTSLELLQMNEPVQKALYRFLKKRERE